MIKKICPKCEALNFSNELNFCMYCRNDLQHDSAVLPDDNQEITTIPKNLKLCSGIDINQIDKMCFKGSGVLNRLNPAYTDRINKIKLEIKQGKYLIPEPPRQEIKPVFIPEENLPFIKPKNRIQLSLFG